MKSRWLVLAVLAAAATSCAQDYKQALPGYQFKFPRDSFNHEDYQTEWWYYTGNVRAKDGHRFGFELTFFRQGLASTQVSKTVRPEAPAETDSNAWSVRDVWMAHMALSDVDGQKFYHEERLNRAGPGLAGVDAQTELVWNGNWQARIGQREEQLQGVSAEFGFALKLVRSKPPVIQGQNGVSVKGEGPGHASHYFSETRLATTGTIELGGESYEVEGASWMDHEFFTGGMAPNETGWDWLSVQLADGSELMLYRLRHADGSVDSASSGSYVDASGTTEFLSLRDFSMSPVGDAWTSAQTKATYPLRWHVSIPRLGMEFEVTTPLRNQEMTERFGPSYWEGAIDITGTRAGAALRGAGYLELTGYADPGRAVIPQ
ncbi:MAG TPA: lipocalin-like domain-containing protein [Terracidiphilus sp.]|jgi:predicted secreted hydrolase